MAKINPVSSASNTETSPRLAAKQPKKVIFGTFEIFKIIILN